VQFASVAPILAPLILGVIFSLAVAAVAVYYRAKLGYAEGVTWGFMKASEARISDEQSEYCNKLKEMVRERTALDLNVTSIREKSRDLKDKKDLLARTTLQFFVDGNRLKAEVVFCWRVDQRPKITSTIFATGEENTHEIHELSVLASNLARAIDAKPATKQRSYRT